jgi:tetratricopeptide (TPR) repeat protein
MHAWVWNHHQELPKSLLDESFLDPIWCQCSVCENTWLISPLLSGPHVSRILEPSTGFRCVSCGQVFCSKCGQAADQTCSCGSQRFTHLRQPNGRKPRPEVPLERTLDDIMDDLQNLSILGSRDPPPDMPLESQKDLHLYFGSEGRVPIGVDPTFPSLQTAEADDHLRWAEILVDVGLFYQAQQQLDLLGEPDASSARTNWLRARLKLVQLHNSAKRRSSWDQWREARDEIKGRLESAVKQSPEFGPAWLTAAQIYLTPDFGPDFARALECAQHAQMFLGKTPAVLLALGKALRGARNPSGAVTILRRIPADSEESALAGETLKLAELEAHCQVEPIDVEAHFQLGRWHWRQERYGEARKLFSRLVDQCPDHAEGYYGMATLAFIDVDKTVAERWTEAHWLCREALIRNPEFGLAYELLGSIFENVRSTGTEVDFPVENPIDYYQRALEYDPDCDVALWKLGADHIEHHRLQPAIELLERAASLGTHYSKVYLILAAIYRGTRQFEKEAWARRKAKERLPEIMLSSEYENKILRLCGFEY